MMLVEVQRKRLFTRLNQVNTLLCNVGIIVSVNAAYSERPTQYVLEVDYGPEGAYAGTVTTYKHERSMIRAAWRLYRQRTGH